MNFRKIIFTFFAVIIFCLIIESGSYALLIYKDVNVGFFWNPAKSQLVGVVGKMFDEIDPLCGWGMSNGAIKKLGYEAEKNCAVIRSKGSYPEMPLRIFITEGLQLISY